MSMLSDLLNLSAGRDSGVTAVASRAMRTRKSCAGSSAKRELSTEPASDTLLEKVGSSRKKVQEQAGAKRNTRGEVKFSSEEDTFMKAAALGLAILLAASSYASAHTPKRHHHHGWSKSMNMMPGPGRSAARSDPNGTAAGPTSVSGTGSSKFGGQIPGAPGATRQP
ncbi:hypothetical protein ML401_38935 [Bradyrhizobium sp. 62B]|nr:hypothetical protein ML401_38935 [Bradyrhizobium sp. 62B]